ncbi:cytochrome P450 [Kibdelosporangium philippinense]|uniref:Cytochrome P450 n=1 Tax=Kibdelosporangium philippinense TaxID=211113 RepID=A0ABS8Z9T6_9PSEU|nr:cytochrome P450 [Kibdelosporangium philippinense]MCE7003303.1 cytochrome P450 [Kibdelosporangium philippinense]
MSEQERVWFNPFLPGFFDDPYPHYKQLATEHPVQDHPLGFWLLTRYDDVLALLRAGQSVEIRNMSGQQQDPAAVLNASMLDRDPPDHPRLRALVTKVFTRRAISALEPRITELVDGALDKMAERGSSDLVEQLAFPLPFAVISEMLGLPQIDNARIRDLSGTLVQSLEVVADEETARAIGDAAAELQALTRDLVAWKRANPADDLLTALIAAEHEGQVLNEDELVSQVVLLYVAGHETTVNLIANGTLALLRNPDQFALLRQQPDLTANAVEEFLRYDSPVQQTRRIMISPYEVGGFEIPRGAFVVACLAAANRDEKVFGPDADKLRLDRKEARHHLSFGGGPHHCLGAALARLEGQIAIGRMVQRFPDLAVDGEIELNNRINLRGLNKLPVKVHATVHG